MLGQWNVSFSKHFWCPNIKNILHRLNIWAPPYIQLMLQWRAIIVPFFFFFLKWCCWFGGDSYFLRSYFCFMWQQFERFTQKDSLWQFVRLHERPNSSLVSIFCGSLRKLRVSPRSVLCFETKTVGSVTAEHISRVLVSLCLTSCVVARRHWLIALIGRLVRQSFGVCVVGGFMGFLVLDEDFAHQLLRTGQGDTWLQLHTHTSETTDQSLVSWQHTFRNTTFVLCVHVTYRVFVQRVNQQRVSENRSTVFCHFSLLLQTDQTSDRRKEKKRENLHCDPILYRSIRMWIMNNRSRFSRVHVVFKGQYDGERWGLEGALRDGFNHLLESEKGKVAEKLSGEQKQRLFSVCIQTALIMQSGWKLQQLNHKCSFSQWWFHPWRPKWTFLCNFMPSLELIGGTRESRDRGFLPLLR